MAMIEATKQEKARIYNNVKVRSPALDLSRSLAVPI